MTAAKDLAKETTHRYGPNSFKLHRYRAARGISQLTLRKLPHPATMDTGLFLLALSGRCFHSVLCLCFSFRASSSACSATCTQSYIAHTAVHASPLQLYAAAQASCSLSPQAAHAPPRPSPRIGGDQWYWQVHSPQGPGREVETQLGALHRSPRLAGDPDLLQGVRAAELFHQGAGG